jgi:hypothetical protein
METFDAAFHITVGVKQHFVGRIEDLNVIRSSRSAVPLCLQGNAKSTIARAKVFGKDGEHQRCNGASNR